MSLLNKASLIQIPSGYKDGTLYSAKPTNGDGDFTFSRGSNLAATRVNSEGLIEKGRENLLLQSNSFNTSWVNTNVSVTSGQSGYDGSSDAWQVDISASFAQVEQSISSSGVQTFSVYAKAGSLNWVRLRVDHSTFSGTYFDLQNGLVGTTASDIDSTIEDVGSGWYRCTITYNNNITKVRIYPAQADNDLTATSGNIIIQDAQLELGLVSTDVITTTTTTEQAGILEDMPRLDYSGGATCPSLLLEGQRSNLLTHSEYFGAWSKIGSPTITSNYGTSPDGLQNSTRIEGVNGDRIYIVAIGSSATYTYSIYAKGSGDIKLRDNSGTYNLSISLTSNWQRYDFSFTASFTNIQLQIDSNTDAEIYGAMIEAGSYPTSYIPTYGSSVTRSADDCVSSDIDELIGDNQGTLFVEGFGEYGNGLDNHLVALSSVSGGSGTDRLLIYTNNTNGNLYIYIDNGGVAQYGSPINLGVQGTSSGDKIAVAYADNDLSVYVNGTQVATSSSGTAPTCFYLQFNEWVGNHQHKSVINQAILFPTRLTNDELASLTTL